MSHRYAPLPSGNFRSDTPAHNELDAAFDDSDDDEPSESQPLNPPRQSPPSSVPAPTPGSYDFENIDYDYPPPGSPPRPSASALPNDYGNSNGLVPSFNLDTSAAAQRRGWFRRTATSILPTYYAQRIWGNSRPSGAIGGGTNNDGVFANVTAKPTPPRRIQDGDETYIVPEDARQEAPPSYALAQQDAVPPYWENTVIAPFSPDALGEMIIDNLPTGSLFSFLWNMLVSISFQFVGFLLTYLLHTTHAARLGSRAGLGVTLIQYGFALRGRMSGEMGGNTDGDTWAGWRAGDVSPPRPSQTGDYYRGLAGNATSPTNTLSPEEAEILVADATTQWLSFFLMTVGWFILLTSLLGFWRVKRWERGILTSQQRDSNSNPSDQNSRNAPIVSQFERAFGLRAMSRSDLFRQGLGFGPRRHSSDRSSEMETIREEDNEHSDGDDEPVIPGNPSDAERARLIAQAYAAERRLQEDLRAAGLL